jgi:hypothetical protein
MQRFNDIANERYKFKSFNDNDTSNKYASKPEMREDGENESLAGYIAQKLGSDNQLPFLAVGYSGIPRSTVDRYIATAQEKGRSQVKLFMYLISKEPLWRKYQSNKAKRQNGENVTP